MELTLLFKLGDEIYGLDVVCIPTNVPVIRSDSDDLIFLTERAKWDAIVEEINELATKGLAFMREYSAKYGLN